MPGITFLRFTVTYMYTSAVTMMGNVAIPLRILLTNCMSIFGRLTVTFNRSTYASAFNKHLVIDSRR